MADMDDAERIDRLERVVAAACDIAGAKGVRSIHLRTERRPTYAELLRYRAHASAADLLMTVLADGGIVLWKARQRVRSSGHERSI